MQLYNDVLYFLNSQAAHLPSKSRHSIDIPNDKLSVHPSSAHLANNSLTPVLVWPNARDRVLMHSEQFRVRSSVSSTTVSTRIRIPECVERGAIQPPNSSSLRTSSLRCTRSSATIQSANKGPTLLRS